MPTIFTKLGYRFFFYSADGREPMHVHVECGNGVGKFWIQPLTLASSYGLRVQDIKKARNLIEENVELIKERWNEFFIS